MIELRDYQKKAVSMVWEYLEKEKGNPCLELATGAGKSHIVATICKEALQKKASTKILMLTHSKELVYQNFEKLMYHIPTAPAGLYSAGLGKREIRQITFAGIQSIYNKAISLGFIDFVIIDEAHVVSHKAQGRYRNLLDDLLRLNPKLRIIGLTATPYRLGFGSITEEPAIFSDILCPISYLDLVKQGYLAPLKSYATRKELDLSKVKKRGGEFIQGELEKATNTFENNAEVVAEILARAGERKSWLIFCVGVAHAEDVRDELKAQGVSAEAVTGKTPKTEREEILRKFKNGEIKALTNCETLTTGFDAPDTDLLVFYRATESPGLYVQMAGRGARLKGHTDHCLVLDFVGLVARHGPVTNVTPPPPKGEKGDGVAPVRQCPECLLLMHASKKACEDCGYIFPIKEKKNELFDDDIMGLGEAEEIDLKGWIWSTHVSRNTQKEMLKVTYFPRDFIKRPVDEYLTVTHEGYAGAKAGKVVAEILEAVGDPDFNYRSIDYSEQNLENLAEYLNRLESPVQVKVKKDGRFYRVLEREFIPFLEKIEK